MSTHSYETLTEPVRLVRDQNSASFFINLFIKQNLKNKFLNNFLGFFTLEEGATEKKSWNTSGPIIL